MAADILVVERSLSSSAKQQQQRPSPAAEDEDFVIGTAAVVEADEADGDEQHCCVQAFDASMVCMLVLAHGPAVEQKLVPSHPQYTSLLLRAFPGGTWAI